MPPTGAVCLRGEGKPREPCSLQYKGRTCRPARVHQHPPAATFNIDDTHLAMRFTLATIVALLGVAHGASAVCCYYGPAGGCRRALDEPLLRLRAEDIESRSVCCCMAAASQCDAHCVRPICSG